MACPTSRPWISRACGEVRLRTPCLGCQWNLHRTGLALVVHQLVGVDARAFHLAIIGRDAPGGFQPGHHVERLGVHAHEVEEAPGLLPVGHGIRLEGVDHVRKLDRIPDEEHLQVVADQIPVPVEGLELDREPARIALRLRALLGACHGGEAHEHRGLHARLVQDAGPGVFAGRLIADLTVGLEITVGAGAARMDHALGNPLAVEMGDLLDELIVFECRGSALADRAHRLVVANRVPLAGRQNHLIVTHAALLSGQRTVEAL